MSSMGETDRSISKPSSPIAPTPTTSVVATSLSVADSKLLDKKKPHRPKSDIWDHFTKSNNEAEKAVRAECTYCKSSYSYSSINGTSTLWKHLNNCIKYPFKKDKKQKILSFQKDAQASEGNLVA